MRFYRQAQFYLRILADLGVLLVSYMLTYIFVPDSIVFKVEENVFVLFTALAILWLFTSKNYGLYDEFRSRNFSYELIVVFKNIFVQCIGTVFIVFVLRENVIPRKFVLVYPAFLLALLAVEKYSIRKIFNALRRRGRNLRSVMIIGAGKVGRGFSDEIKSNQHFGYRFLGFLDDKVQKDLNGEYLGPVSELNLILDSKNVDDVIIALPGHANQKMKEVLATCERFPVKVRIVPDYFQFTSERYDVSMFGKFPIITAGDYRINEFHWRLIKRCFDTIFSLVSFVFFFSWLFPLIAVLIKLDSKGPVFFKQERWGRNNKRFTAYKFRSLASDCEEFDEKGKFLQVTKNDSRITRIGKFLRKSNFDELPQFINVIKGEISIVGPRPHPTPLNYESREYINNYMQRHIVKPGITGWAQVNGLRGETKDKKLMEKRVKYDLWYIENWTIWLDIQIIFLTVWNMLKGDPKAY